MRSFIFSQCRDFRTGVMWEDCGVLVTAQAREFCMFWSLFIWDWKIIVQWVAVVKFRMNDRSGDGTGSFEVKIRTKTAKFTNMVIARVRESKYLVRESEVFIKDKTKIASWVSSNQWAGINFGKLLWEADKKKFSFRRVEC